MFVLSGVGLVGQCKNRGQGGSSDRGGLLCDGIGIRDGVRITRGGVVWVKLSPALVEPISLLVSAVIAEIESGTRFNKISRSYRSGGGPVFGNTRGRGVIGVVENWFTIGLLFPKAIARSLFSPMFIRVGCGGGI